MSVTLGNRNPMLDYQVRRLESRDVPEVFETFHEQSGFHTGGLIRFYDEVELEYWTHDKQSLFLVLECTGKATSHSITAIVGFAFVKYISPSWAMLDGLYVLPEHRKQAGGRLLMAWAIHEIEQHGTEYVCTMVEDPQLELWLGKHGFKPGKKYQWMEKWTKAPRTTLGRLGYDRLDTEDKS